jgi:hypothetical protein
MPVRTVVSIAGAAVLLSSMIATDVLAWREQPYPKAPDRIGVAHGGVYYDGVWLPSARTYGAGCCCIWGPRPYGGYGWVAVC